MILTAFGFVPFWPHFHRVGHQVRFLGKMSPLRHEYDERLQFLVDPMGWEHVGMPLCIQNRNLAGMKDGGIIVETQPGRRKRAQEEAKHAKSGNQWRRVNIRQAESELHRAPSSSIELDRQQNSLYSNITWCFASYSSLFLHTFNAFIFKYLLSRPHNWWLWGKRKNLLASLCSSGVNNRNAVETSHIAKTAPTGPLIRLTGVRVLIPPSMAPIKQDSYIVYKHFSAAFLTLYAYPT